MDNYSDLELISKTCYDFADLIMKDNREYQINEFNKMAAYYDNEAKSYEYKIKKHELKNEKRKIKAEERITLERMHLQHDLIQNWIQVSRECYSDKMAYYKKQSELIEDFYKCQKNSLLEIKKILVEKLAQAAYQFSDISKHQVLTVQLEKIEDEITDINNKYELLVLDFNKKVDQLQLGFNMEMPKLLN